MRKHIAIEWNNKAKERVPKKRKKSGLLPNRGGEGEGLVKDQTLFFVRFFNPSPK